MWPATAGRCSSDEQYHNIGVPPYQGWEDDPLAQITFRFELYAKGSTEELYRNTKDDPGLYFRTKDAQAQGQVPDAEPALHRLHLPLHA